MTVFTISTELLIFLQSHFIGWYIIISWSFLCQNWIVFKVTVIVKVQTFIESLCILYLLYHFIDNQTRCADLILFVIKPSTTKWAYTESSTLTYSITKHASVCVCVCVGGGLPRKATNLVSVCLF